MCTNPNSPSPPPPSHMPLHRQVNLPHNPRPPPLPRRPTAPAYTLGMRSAAVRPSTTPGPNQFVLPGAINNGPGRGFSFGVKERTVGPKSMVSIRCVDGSGGLGRGGGGRTRTRVWVQWRKIPARLAGPGTWGPDEDEGLEGGVLKVGPIPIINLLALSP
jgi:hypothetical protein